MEVAIDTASIDFGHDALNEHARGADLFDTEPTFRREVDRCAELLQPHLGVEHALGARDQPGSGHGGARGQQGVGAARTLSDVGDLDGQQVDLLAGGLELRLTAAEAEGDM